jgi:hypothetical protein
MLSSSLKLPMITIKEIQEKSSSEDLIKQINKIEFQNFDIEEIKDINKDKFVTANFSFNF